MQIVADLQLHSKYSRAVSGQMTIPFIAEWAGKKGIGLVATGDWTHPLWFREIQANLEEVGNGLLKLKSQISNLKTTAPASAPRSPSGTIRSRLTERSSAGRQNSKLSNQTEVVEPVFLLATEVSSIYSQGGKGRRVHTLVWVPALAAAEKINEQLRRRGCNLMSDGRPIIGLSCIEVADLVLNIEPKALIIPAHAWTPWFSVFGGMSGFDSLEEAFGKFSKNVYATETGLSSNPAMNWRIKELDNRAILSFSDAHSGPKLGREATVFEVGELSYENIRSAISQLSVLGSLPAAATPQALRAGRLSVTGQPVVSLPVFQTDGPKTDKLGTENRKQKTDNRIAYTIEFYPEEGKYHYSGHRNCGVSFGPEETAKNKGICPVCGRGLTQGVMQRVEELASRSEGDLQISEFRYQSSGIRDQGSDLNSDSRMIGSKTFPKRPPFAMLVPLMEIISEAIGSPVSSPKTILIYDRLVQELGGEFAVLLHASIDEIVRITGERVAEGVSKVRKGEIEIKPGYDGVFGKVKIWKEKKEQSTEVKEQLALF